MNKTEQTIAEASRLGGVLNQVERDKLKSWTENCLPIHTEEDVQAEIVWREEQLPILVKAFPEKIVVVAVRKALQLRMANVRKMREKCYDRYEELRKNGVPLLERRKELNQDKVEWCDRIEAELVTWLKSVRIRPHSEWLWRGDYERMKRMGFNWFIQFELPFRNITY